MSFSVNALKVYTDTLANIDQTGANFTADQFNNVIYDSILDLLEQYFGKPKWFNIQPHLSNERGQAIKDYISNSEIHVYKDLPVDQDGILTLPSDYLHLTSLYYDYVTNEEQVCYHCGSVKCTCPGKLPTGFRKGLPKGCVVEKVAVTRNTEVTIVNSSQWSFVKNHPLIYPDYEHPYGKYLGSGKIEVAPQAIPKLRLTYIRYPKVAKWGSTPQNGVNIYDSNASVDVELPRILLKELSTILLEAMGFHTREYWMEQVKRQEMVSGA